MPVPIVATGNSTATSISVGVTAPALSSSLTVSAPPLVSPMATLTLGGAQLITAMAGMAAATAGIPGALISRVPMGTIFRVPLDVGAVGSFVTSSAIFFPSIAHSITVDFYGWTPGTLTFTGLTTKLAPLPTVVAMGSFALTPNGGGTVTLVSPTKITARSSLTFKTNVSISTLTLLFVPEPSSLLLIAGGAIALACARRRYGNTR